MSSNNNEELNKPAASSQSKRSTSTTNDTTTKPSPQSSTQPKMEAAKPSPTSAASTASTAAAAKPSAAAPPAKTQPEPPPFEKGLVEQIRGNFGDLVKVVFIRPLRIKLLVEPQDIVRVASFLRDSMGFDHAESVGGTDYPKDNQIEVIYHLGSYTREELAAHILWLTTRTDRDDARLPTLINVYKSVEYHERECYEMLGVYFEGHPRNERFLLPEDWADIPPLRKDFRIKGR
ncbi:MAG: NADH-quinone oxidoreductase subunit C [Nitrososphaera sp.]